MKHLAAIEFRRLVKELKPLLVGGKINQIYVDREKKEMLIEIYVSNKGRQLLRILFPSFLYISSVKPETPAVPDSYCMYLRKYLKNARLKDIMQVGAERIVCVVVEARDISKKEYVPVIYKMYIELFSKGNFILANSQDVILSPLEIQQWSGRSVKAKEQYTYPQQEYNIFAMTEEEFEKALSESTKESLVAALAIDFGLGGMYAEEVCKRAGIPKDAKPSFNSKKVYVAFQELVHDVEAGAPLVTMKGNKPEDVFPCSLKTHPEGIQYQSFIEALDAYFIPFILKKEHVEQISRKETAEQKLKTMIASQEKQISVYEEEYHANQRIAEIIYHHYSFLDSMCKELQQAEEIKKIIKKYAIIKKINEKNKEVVVEL